MQLRRRLGIITLLIIILAFNVPDKPLRAADLQDLQKINELIEETKEELSQKKIEEKSVLNSLLRAQKELNQIENDLEYVNTRIRQTEQSISRLKKEMGEIERERNRLEEESHRRREKLNQRLVAAYKYGLSGYLELLLSVHSFGDLISNFETLAYFVKNDLSLLEEFNDTKEKILAKQKAYEEKKEKLEAERKRYSWLRKDAEKKQRQKAVMIGNTKNELKRINTDLQKLEAALDELERTSKEIEEQIRKKQRGDQVLGTGSMLWPVRGRISSYFGWRTHPILKKRKFHSGIDIAVPNGTSIKAADTGTVLISGWHGGYGYFVAIDHGNGISTAYGHNSRLLVKEGEVVVKGQIISKSGTTGLSTGPHLHFEVRENGKPANPINYLPRL